MVSKTIWMSFVKPAGFAGVCLVEIDDRNQANGLRMADLLFPDHRDTDGSHSAALRESHKRKCNPGGEAMSFEIPAEALPQLAHVPRNTLLSRADMEALGLAPKSYKEMDEEESQNG